MNRFLIAIVLLLACSTQGCAHHHKHARGPWDIHKFALLLPDEHRCEFPNISYSTPNKSIQQTLDLYIPLNRKPPYPLIIWVHGGAWGAGDKKPCFACNKFFSDYAIASVNYRLSNSAFFPCQIYDLKAAVRYLRAHAKQYQLDPERFGAWGSSAGGHLVALLGTSGDAKELEGKQGNLGTSSKVQAVCDWCGPTDFNTADAQAGRGFKIRYKGPTSPVFVLMGAKMDEVSLAQASPVTYVSKDSPPFLIMHGGQDDAVPPAQSEELYNKLRASSVDATYQLLPEYGHSFMAPEHFQTVKDFFDRTLLKSPQSQIPGRGRDAGNDAS